VTTWRNILAVLMLICLPGLAISLQILAVDVEYESKRYYLFGESIIEAPAEFIQAILVDYVNFHRLTSGITDSKFITDPDYEDQLGYTRVDSCVLFFCKRIVKVDQIVYDKPGTVITLAVPEQSNFKFHWTRWTLKSVDGGTQVTYEATLEPDFWMPPLIGPWALKRKLRKSAEEIGERIEYLVSTGQSITDLKE
jgi:hypothetical protein